MTGRTDDGAKNKRPKGPGVCLAQANGLGQSFPPKSLGPTARPFGSIPNITFINFDFMSLTHGSELILKREPFMMFRLTSNVGVDISAFGMTDREDTVAGLPRKHRVSAIGFLRPLRCFGLNVFDKLRDRYRSRQSNKQVNMVDMAADRRTDTARFLNVIGEHTKRLFTERLTLKKRSPVFRRKDKMEPNLCKGLRHGGIPLTIQMTGPLALRRNQYTSFPGRWPGLGKQVALRAV